MTGFIGIFLMFVLVAFLALIISTVIYTILSIIIDITEFIRWKKRGKNYDE